MKHISSRSNPEYRQLLRLAEGRHGAQAVLEGLHLCQEWVAHYGAPRYALFDEALLARQQDGELGALFGALGAAACATCEPALMRALSPIGQDQGVCFLVDVPRPPRPERIDADCLWLDRVQDPGNVGTLLRTAAAAGVGQAYLSPGCAAAWSPKVLRSAQGAHFAMAIHEHVDLAAERARLAVPLLATSLQDGVSLYARALPGRCAWLFGNEGRGVDPALLQLADLRVFIPQAAGVESLNVSAAAAVCLFEQRRQRLAAHGVQVP
ncbi:TrmH family RNA methyltransferase [Candidimonas nitroreducens]|uniref:RNA methyltransferase n=1 Tax=Candidimonas nitroreducens TaxID=683354 RepID=A0A225N0U8_9BURK|nr:RNA methyltransferase [Candidimonas nitroreducens]OWT65481.1 RNA methyltransferase [Candidimonas nitroreducens]